MSPDQHSGALSGEPLRALRMLQQHRNPNRPRENEDVVRRLLEEPTSVDHLISSSKTDPPGPSPLRSLTSEAVTLERRAMLRVEVCPLKNDMLEPSP